MALVVICDQCSKEIRKQTYGNGKHTVSFPTNTFKLRYPEPYNFYNTSMEREREFCSIECLMEWSKGTLCEQREWEMKAKALAGDS